MDFAQAPPSLQARYRSIGPLPEGRLWRVLDTNTGRPALCRRLGPATGPTDAADGLARRQALWSLSRLDHPALAGILHHATAADGATWLVQPWIDAPRLSAAAPLPPLAAGRLLADLLGALDCMHRHGLVHGDLDARRVRVGKDGAAVLMDAGLAAAALTRRVGRPDPDPRGDLRAAGALVLASMAPADTAGQSPLDAVLARLVSSTRPGFLSAREALAALGLVAESEDALLPATPLMGREIELAHLDAALAPVVAGRVGPPLWLAGPPGVGKSRLIDAFGQAVDAAGVLFARGGAADGQGREMPYGPLARIMRSLLPVLEQEAPETLARLGPVLGRLLPELAPAGIAPTLEPPSAKLRLQGALADALTTLARRRGLVLAIEDWERLDPLSAEAFARIAHTGLGAPLLIVVAADTAGPRPAWATDATVMQVAGLDVHALGRLAAAHLGAPEAPSGLAERLAAASGGLPRRAEASLRGLIATGVLRRVADGWALGTGDMPDNQAPLAGLPAAAVAVAHVAALLGGAADLDVVSALATDEAGLRLSEDDLFAALDTLARAGVLTPGADGSLGFAQVGLADQIRDGLAPATCRAFHRAAAEAYHARAGTPDAAPLPVATATAIARHALAGDLADLATTYALDAGRRLAAMHAAEEATALLAAGLDRIRLEGRAAWIRRRLDLTEALADVHRLAGRLAEAQALYGEGERLSVAVGDRLRLGRLYGSLAKIHQVRDDLEAAADFAAQAMTLSRETGDADGLARSLLTAARLSVYAGRTDQARVRAAEALGHARVAGDPTRIAESLALLGYLLAHVPDTRAQGMERLQEAIGLLTNLGDPIGLNMAASMLGDAQAAGGNLEAARKSYRLAHWILRDMGVRTEAGITAINLGLAALELGEPTEAATQAVEAREIASALGHRFQVVLADALAAAAAAACGDHSGALAHADAAHQALADLANSYLEGLVLPLVLEARLRAGDLTGASALATHMPAGEGDAARARRLALHAEIAGRLGDLDFATTCATEALVTAVAADAPVERARAHLAAAWVALARGESETARNQAAQARTLAEQLGLRLQVAAAEGLLGEAALLSGTLDPRPHFTAMAALASEAGAHGQAAEGLAALARLDDAWLVHRIAPRATPTPPNVDSMNPPPNLP